MIDTAGKIKQFRARARAAENRTLETQIQLGVVCSRIAHVADSGSG